MGIEEKNNVIKLFKDNSEEKHSSISIYGNENIVGNGNIIVRPEKIFKKTTVIISSDDNIHITDRQALSLKELVSEVIRLEKSVKRRPATFAAVWGAVNKHCGVPQYRLIRQADFEKACKYLCSWIGRLSDAPSAVRKMPEDIRKRRTAYIQINMKKLNCENKVRGYAFRKFGTASLRLLDMDELEAVYRYVAGLKGEFERKSSPF